MFRLILSFLVLGFAIAPVRVAIAKDLSDKDICRAAMSTIFNEELEDVESKKNVLNVHYINIPKPKDNSSFKFKCTAVDGLISWGSELGAWQNTDLDSKVTYEIKDGFLIVSELYNSGYKFNKRFKLSLFKDK